MPAVISENALTILKKRYLSNGESIDDMWDRVSGGNPKFRALLSELRFLPNSPTLFNMGLNNGCTSSACFVFDVDDSMMEGPRSIHNTRGKAIAVAKAGGGVGYYFGNIRPKGSLIKSIHRKACGPVAVLRDYHGVRQLVTQGGKRDLAQMGILNCEAEDIFEFVHAKDEDPKSLESFNISVGWSNAYVKESQIPDTRAARLWEEQVDSAWHHGCPGMFFPDVVNAANPNLHLGLINATNPCFTGDTKVWTIYGPRRFDELVGSDIPVLTQDSEDKLVFRMMREIKKTRKDAKVYRVTVKAQKGRAKKGQKPHYVFGEFTATGNHQVFLRDGSQKAVKDLTSKDRLASAYRRRANQKGYLSLKNTAGDSDMEHRIVMSWEHGGRPDYPAYHVDHIDENKANNLPENLRVLTAREHNALNMLGERNPVVRFPEKNVFRTAGFREKYKPQGFTGRNHSEESKRKISEGQRRAMREGKHNHQVVSVEYVGREDVYDGTVDDFHRFFVVTEEDGGVLVHNCGETPNRSDEPCNLGSLPLPRYFLKGNRGINWKLLEEDAYVGTEFLDDILDRNTFPHPDITEAALLTRKLGLGVMGWADLLALMHIHYDTAAAVDLGRQIMKLIADVSLQASIDMAKKKGPYKGYSETKTQGPFCRNETRTSIAPTGTIALIADVFGSIEPFFATEWERTTNEGIKMQERISVWNDLEGFVPKIANEISLDWHIRHQAAFQEFTDLGVSKTINLPNSATREDVSRAYRMMHDLGCKGGTIFRDGCRSEQVLVSKKTTSVYSLPSLPDKRRMPKDRHAVTHKFRVGGVKGYLTVGLYDDGAPGEIFLRVSKQGSTTDGMFDTWAMTVSKALQRGMPLSELVALHSGRRFEPSGLTDSDIVPVCSSVPDYVVRWMDHKFSPKTNGEATSKAITDSGFYCPDCDGPLAYRDGCLSCLKPGCGWSKCG